MAEHPNWERHWSAISLGIVTVATAAIGAAFFAIDLTEVVTSLITYFLVVIAISVYLWVLILGGRSIFSTSDEAILLGMSKRQLAQALYRWFFLELFVLAMLLIPEAFASLLRSLTSA